MELERIKEHLAAFDNVSVGVIGDFCVDAYWSMDTGKPELSLETGRPTSAVRKQRYSLGGAGNVVANLAALGVGTLRAFAVVGDDLFGREMRRLLENLGVDCDGIVAQRSRWDTSVYAKPHVADEEQDRVDFGRYNRITRATARRIIERLAAALPETDVVIVNQQLPHGINSAHVIAELNRLAAEHSNCRFIVDSRDMSDRFENMIIKLNTLEASRLCGEQHDINHAIPPEDARRYARAIWKRKRKPVCVTRGTRGIVGYDGRRAFSVPGIQTLGRTDPVGAGDTVAAALGSALAAGASLEEAAIIANCAATVIVQKLRQTGTSSRDEILAVGQDIDYEYRPEHAEDIRRARYAKGTDIEVVNEAFRPGRIRHAVFDHDGTVSTLRQGWEKIMAPVMMKAILGKRYETASEESFHKVSERVHAFIDKSTGIQTILQMEGLVEMVREFGFVPRSRILTAAGYKRIYNDALMKRIRERLQRFEKGERDAGDYTVKGAVDFLKAIKRRGVTLYLASGTDEHDVQNEAQVLGYASLFKGGVFGALGDISKYSKKMVIERIMRENALSGSELAVFGDGPVELREARKRDGITVGIASDEVRRYGLDAVKRTRLVKAGADLVVPDFSQGPKLLTCLFGK